MFRKAGAAFRGHRTGRYAYILDGAHMSIVISEFRKQCGENTALDPFSFIMESDLGTGKNSLIFASNGDVPGSTTSFDGEYVYINNGNQGATTAFTLNRRSSAGSTRSGKENTPERRGTILVADGAQCFRRPRRKKNKATIPFCGSSFLRFWSSF